ncbi:MAG: NAD-glutamate dehydrogenase [Wenzhouxiangellaceae bacterium]
MQHPQPTSKQELLGQIAALDESGVLHGDNVPGFAAQFYARAPAEELNSAEPEWLAAIAANVAAFIQQRPERRSRLRVYNPEPDQHGWSSQHTIIEMLNDDMPFLVDTATMTLSEMGISIHLIVHPVLWVQRDEQGELQRLLAKGDSDGQPESVIHIQIDRQAVPAVFSRIEKRLREALADVRAAVVDWRAMRESINKVADDLPQMAPGYDVDNLREKQDFLRWLADDHFTFLGYRKYEVIENQGEREIVAIADSGLGILRHQDNARPRKLASLSGSARAREQQLDPVLLTKTNARSTVHRTGYLDYIGVLHYDRDGKVLGEHRFLGLFTSGALNRSTRDTPLVRQRVAAVIQRSGLQPRSHEGKALIHTLETLPRDELFQSSAEELHALAMGILDLQERPQTRLFVRRELFGRFYSCMVFIPRDRFNTENRERIQGILKRALKAVQLDYAVHVSDSNLARLHVIIRVKPQIEPEFEVRDIENRIITAIRSWQDELKAILVQKHGELEGLRLADLYGKAFPTSYTEDVSPWVASFDVLKVAALSGDDDLQMSLYRPRRRTSHAGMLRFKIFCYGEPLALSRVLPMLEGLGLRIINERPYELILPGSDPVWIQDLDMVPAIASDIDLEMAEEKFQEAFRRIANDTIESDDLNRLVLAAHLDWRQVRMLRAYCRYLLQTGLPLSQAYMEETLGKHPLISRLLVALFEQQFQPAAATGGGRGRELKRSLKSLLRKCAEHNAMAEMVSTLIEQWPDDRDSRVERLRQAITTGLDEVSSQDEDRILRGFFEVIVATLRTNYFQRDVTGEPAEFLSFKIDSTLAPELPKPRPFREIWVYSPRVEGIHLRGGLVARGGLRWSDRREDFRTEVLGLMKAQNVKNTLIVPVGAKGGFVVKRPPEGADRETLMKEVVHCYRTFITGLLTITDNRRDERIIPPERVVRRDGDDSYLVVAADKGTATFSDTANQVAAEHEFWLDDAFASGGSNGYDHKGMGITAKGAWECVKRHFREMGIDTQSQDFTVVGVGDMSGDVFGNGMLLSRHIRLQAAFNHLHIFIDPNPDAAASFAERERLFNLPRSSWDDYNRDCISKGGGIWSRNAKSIELTPEIRGWLGIEAQRLTPQELIRHLLRAPVDLFWNGGIGTYVKASTESHADADDRTNNALRIDASELRCKVVGEGGNLGLTQRARIEYALAGGRINTDFIDNSAGVDCSDHEVNIKILLSQAGDRLDTESRNQLLRDMKDEVERLVLRSNYLQSQSISQMEQMAAERMGAKAHLIATLERKGLLDRHLEFLPDNETLRERMARGEPLTRPELAVLLSYSKIHVYQELLRSDVPEDPFLTRELVAYFPSQLHEDFRPYMDSHPLKREIIATVITNSMVNRMGASFALRVQEDTGADIAAIAKAYTIAREVFSARQFWQQLESLDNQASAELQSQALMRMWDLVRHATRWFLSRRDADNLNIEQMVERYSVGVQHLRNEAQPLLPENERAVVRADAARFHEGGFSEELATEAASQRLLIYALDVVDESANRGMPIREVLETYFAIDRLLDLSWLRAVIEQLPTSGHWDAHARGHLRSDLQRQHRALTGNVMSIKGDDNFKRWRKQHHDRIQRARVLIEEMRSQSMMDFASVTVAVQSLAQLVTASR